MITSLDETKQKRNKPCENCRSQRRRCIPTESTQCERCIKKRLSCIYKVTAKPLISKNIIPTAKRLRVWDLVRDIEETLNNIEQDMQLVISSSSPPSSSSSTNNQYQHQRLLSLDSFTAMNSSQKPHSPISASTQQDTHLTQQPTWTVTIQPSKTGMQLETSINSIVDLVQFLAQGLGYVPNPPQRSPNYYSNNTQQTMMTVTNRMLQVEQTLRQVFGKTSTYQQRQQQQQQQNDSTFSALQGTTIYSDDFIRQVTVLHLVKSHFHCVRSMTPIVLSYYFPLISNQPDSTVAYALAGFMALSSCVVHVNDKWIPYNRADFGRYLYHSAGDKLRDDLFDDDAPPSLETVLALLTITRCSMILLRNNETQLYLHLAWRMILALRDEHLPVLRRYQQQQYPHHTDMTFTTPELARAETWRRLFYGVRYLVIHVQIIQDNSVDFYSLLAHSDIGYPIPLPCEMGDPQRKRVVETFGYYVQMDDCHISSKVDTIGYQLFAGVLDEASLFDISFMEHRLFSFWQGLPDECHLTSTPIEYLDPSAVTMCQDHHILRLNQLYYSHLLSLEIRFMQSPSNADLKDTSLGRMDGGRALLLVSICGDALAHLFQTLSQRETCTLDLHWLLITTDALQLLTKTANASVRKRAERNLQMCRPIMMAQMKTKHDTRPLAPSSSLITPPPPPASPPPPLPPSVSASALLLPLPLSSSSIMVSPSLSSSSIDISSSSSVPTSSPTSSSTSSPSPPPYGPSTRYHYHHANSPGNCSTGTSNDEADDEFIDCHSSSSMPVSSNMDPSLAYYGEVKKNLESYFTDDQIVESD